MEGKGNDYGAADNFASSITAFFIQREEMRKGKVGGKLEEKRGSGEKVKKERQRRKQGICLSQLVSLRMDDRRGNGGETRGRYSNQIVFVT